MPGLRERRLPLLGRLARERGEADLGIEIRSRRLEAHVGDLGGHVLAEVPGRDVAVPLAGVPLGGRERGQLEPRMPREQADEALPDRARGAEDRDLTLAHRQ